MHEYLNSTSPTPTRITALPDLPSRDADAHKGRFGRVLIVAGSRGMSGAACLAGLGCLRGGAGLVYLAVPDGIVLAVAAAEPSYLTIPLPEDEQGRLSSAAGEQLQEIVERHDAIAIGPGWGTSAALLSLTAWIYTNVKAPLVVDADGLNALAADRAIFSETAPPGNRILTPHPGEFARLLGCDIATVQQHRESLAAEFARRHRVIVVLKGPRTVITDGDCVAINQTGNSGMATGGSGDVLTGLIAALLAQGMPAFAAAQFGVHLHGLAGDLAADDLSQAGMIASDLPNYLPMAWKAMESDGD